MPGVVAFAVDFSNGTIYLPEEAYGAADSRPESSELREIRLTAAELSNSRIQAVVAEHVGREVRLLPGKYETRELQSIDDFWNTNQSFKDA